MVPVSSLQCLKAITEGSPYSDTFTDHLGTKDILTYLAKCRACQGKSLPPDHWRWLFPAFHSLGVPLLHNPPPLSVSVYILYIVAPLQRDPF